ncbi:MAG: hypothetical protein CMJ16_03490 [Peredibacter sp.]|nr:hypothetical protein [Peredibacter sp.]
MKKKFVALCISFAISPHSYAVFGQDTALLVELVTTTASQLNEMEKLVSNSEKYTRQMQKYNELFEDEYFRAQRVLFIAESLAAKKEANDLGELNWAIKELKYSMSEVQGLMREYAQIKNDEDKTKNSVKVGKKINKSKSKIAKHQVKSSVEAKTNKRTNQLAAQNTALIYEQSVDMHNTQLEILEKLSTTNRLLAEEMEEKRFKEIQKEKTYGVER